jgi:hypothetical protein
MVDGSQGINTSALEDTEEVSLIMLCVQNYKKYLFLI